MRCLLSLLLLLLALYDLVGGVGALQQSQDAELHKGIVGYDKKTACKPRAHEVDATEKPAPIAPDTFFVRIETTNTVTTASTDIAADEAEEPAGNRPIVIQALRKWSPQGVDRFYQLVRDNHFDCNAFFRVVPGFVVQFGIAAEPENTVKWQGKIEDDPVVVSNLFSTLSFATSGPNTRSMQLFINLNDNSFLDGQGFSPFGQVIQGMETVLNITNPTPKSSSGIDQHKSSSEGNHWILKTFPQVDIITNVELLDELN